MTQTKPKEKEQGKTKIGPGSQNKPKIPEGLMAVSAKWQQEISELQGREFENMDAAVEAVTDAVVKRYGGGAETREFLKSIFDMDPKVQDDLRRVLKIAAK